MLTLFYIKKWRLHFCVRNEAPIVWIEDEASIFLKNTESCDHVFINTDARQDVAVKRIQYSRLHDYTCKQDDKFTWSYNSISFKKNKAQFLCKTWSLCVLKERSIRIVKENCLVTFMDCRVLLLYALLPLHCVYPRVTDWSISVI